MIGNDQGTGQSVSSSPGASAHSSEPRHPLVRATLPREVAIPRRFRGPRYYRVRPATVAEAMALYAAAPGALAGEPADGRVFDETAAGWLPGPVARHLAKHPIEERLGRTFDLLDHGVFAGDVGGSAEAAEDPFDAFAGVAWDVLALYYAHLFHASPADVLGTPWALFLLALSKAENVVAIANLNALEVAVVPHAGEQAEGLIKDMKKRAGSVTGKKKAAGGAGAGGSEKTPDEVVWENLNKLKGLMGSNRSSGAGRRT